MSSNDREFLVQKIRTQYTQKQHTELDALKALDRKVKKPANVFGYVYGSLGGMALVALAYPVYNRVLKKERRRIAPEILRLTEELLK